MAGGRRHTARVLPDDAAAVGVADGELLRISSPTGSIEIEAQVTDEIVRGTVAVPHGWGHRGGTWSLANATPGVNINVLASTEIEDLERLSGMTLLDGIPVRLEPVASATSSVPSAASGAAA